MELVSGSELRLALLGKSGNGKNSVANSVLGASAHASKVTSSITQHYHLATGQFCGRQISILDTAVPWDTQQSTKKVQEEVRKCVRLLTPGPHAFLLVLEIEKSNSEEREMVRQIQQALGPKALEYMMVVFTHGDCLDERVSVGDLLVEDSDSLGKMVTSCGGRFCIFNKHSAKSKEQSVKLLSMVDQILQTNGGKYFTSKMLQAADEEEERLAKNMEGLLRTQLTTPVREWHHHKKIQLNNFRSTEDPSPTSEKQRENERDRLTREREEKGRRILTMIGEMEARRKDKVMREILREEQREREERVRRDIEALVQREREELSKREKEKRLQEVQREQATRRSEAVWREALQRDVDRLTKSIVEQTKREEELERERGELIQRERESQREREKEKGSLREERKEKESLKQQLWVIAMRKEGEKERRAEVQPKINVGPRKEEKGQDWTHSLSQCNRESVDQCHEALWKPRSSAQEGSMPTSPVTGYIQEMGVVLLNAALHRVGRPCSIQ